MKRGARQDLYLLSDAVLGMIQDKLAASKHCKIVRLDFNPWHSCCNRNRRFTIAVQSEALNLTPYFLGDGTVMLKASTLALGLFCAAFAFAASAAAEELTVKTDQTMLIKLSGKPGTVAVGNPSIADATFENGNLFVTGRSFGSTNLIALDQNGKELVNLSISVQSAGNNNVVLFAAGARRSMACAPLCEASVEPGDDQAYTKNVITVIQQKAGLAGAAPQGDATQGASAGATPQ
jgi:Pilus formation protein N terminal region